MDSDLLQEAWQVATELSRRGGNRMNTLYPSIYQINTRVWLQSLTAKYGQPISLTNVPEEELQRIAMLGFDWLWLLGIWRTSDLGRQIAL